MPSPESPMSFRESLPPHARNWVWIPTGTVTLCLDLPTGEGTCFQVYRCSQQQMLAHNVAQVALGAVP
jgi:hypothetical protein